MTGVRKVTLKSGAPRWEFVTDVGVGPDGKRRQERRRYPTKKEAEAEFAKTRHGVNQGTYVRRWDGTVSEVIDSFLGSAHIRSREANTQRSYAEALAPARERLGQYKARTITRQHIEDLADWMISSGRKRGGPAGTGLAPGTAARTVKRLRAAFELACRDGLLPANPALYATLPVPDSDPDEDDDDRTTWTPEQAGRFLAVAAQDRLYGAWRLSVRRGMRRGEICGLQWAQVDLDAGRVEIPRRASTRVLVAGEVIVKGPKSKRGARSFRLSAEDVAALRAMKARQASEALAAGPGTYEPSGFVVCDELGQPVKPDWYSREFRKLSRRAGLPDIELHGLRRTLNAELEAAGVSPNSRASLLGHRVETNQASYLDAVQQGIDAATAAIDLRRLS